MSRNLAQVIDIRSHQHIMDGPRHAEFVAAQQRHGLTHGDRPLCRHLQPHLISRIDFDQTVDASELVVAALERLAERALVDEELAIELGLSADERALAAIYPGYQQWLTVGRLDGVPTERGIQFVELNADSPAGLADQLLVDRTLFALPHLRDSNAGSPPAAHSALLAALLRTYAAWSGQSRPSVIAIVDWASADTSDETRVLANVFERAGVPTLRLDPDELSFDGRSLNARGRRIDCVYRRVIVQELIERGGLDHPLFQAYRAQAVCVANSFRTKALNKKAAFALLSDPRFESMFSIEQREAIAAHVPWTRCVRPGTTEWRLRDVDLMQMIVDEREQLVLKPNDDYGGKGVLLGWRTHPDAWQRALRRAAHEPMVVQERVEPITIRAPAFDGELVEEDVFFDLCPYVFGGRMGGVMTRFSSSPLTNVSAGGGVGGLRICDG